MANIPQDIHTEGMLMCAGRQAHLNDPVNGGEVQPAGSDVRGEENHRLGLAELVEDRHAFQLFHLAV